jgi:hypothetical protein
VSEDILALDAEDVCTTEVLDQIAWVTQGHWVEVGDVRILMRMGEAPSVPSPAAAVDLGAPRRLDSGAILRTLSTYDRLSPDPEALPDPFLTWLRDPVHYDPLSVGVPEALEFAAKLKKQAVIANLDDSTFDEVFMAAQEGWNEDSSPGQLFDHFEQPETYERRDSDRWLAIRPLNIRQTTASRLSRHALGRAMHGLLERGWVRFEELAEIAGAVEDEPATYFRLAVLTGQQTPSSTVAWRLLQLLGKLSPEMRQRLLKGETLMDTDFPPNVLSLINSLRITHSASDIEAVYEREPSLAIPGVQAWEGEETAFNLVDSKTGWGYGQANPERHHARILIGELIPPPCRLEETLVQKIGIPTLTFNLGACKHGALVLTMRSRYSILRSKLLPLSDLLPSERRAVEEEYTWRDSFRWDR